MDEFLYICELENNGCAYWDFAENYADIRKKFLQYANSHKYTREAKKAFLEQGFWVRIKTIKDLEDYFYYAPKETRWIDKDNVYKALIKEINANGH